MNRGMLLHAPLGAVAGDGWPTRLLEGLPYARRLALEQRATADRYASLAGLALALCAVGRLRVAAVPALRTLTHDAGGKPAFPGAPHFSVSHCQGYVACIAVESVAVGLDLEAVPEMSRRDEVARWTAIEAVLKAAGRGVRAAGEVELAANGSSARFAGEAYTLHAVPGLRAEIVAHVASRSPIEFDVAEVALDDPAIASVVERSLGLPA